jgi:glycosyltransferase involved in cell wall biosynthesis
VFNDYRIPSKLPEFFAMGLPVILPRTNVGLLVRDGEECLLLEQGDAEDIALKVERVLHDDALAARLGRGARSFAERTFSWERSAQALQAFYETTLVRA